MTLNKNGLDGYGLYEAELMQFPSDEWGGKDKPTEKLRV